MPRVKMYCKCGASVTTNTFRQHLKSSRCNAEQDYKDRCLNILSILSKNGDGWAIKDGVNATKNSKWWLSVINNETKLEDWVFKAPRPTGQVTPNTALKMAKDRVGANNPVVKARMPNYNIEDLKSYVKLLLNTIIEGSGSFLDILPLIEEKYPNYKYMFADIEPKHPHLRGHSKSNTVLAHLLDMSIYDLIKISHKLRGRSISRGQLASDKFLSFASKHAAHLVSSLRVSVPQKILYQMIISVDPKAILEKPWKFGKVYKAFDIYSPKISAVIEMHGRVFHDINKCNEKMKEMVKSNIKNDLLKKSLVESIGISYIEFWDDESNSWFNKILDIYGEEPISYEEAKNKVNEESRHPAGNGYVCP